MTRFAPHHSFDAAPCYLVWRDYGRHGFEGVAYPETSKRNIIEDIQSGQIDRVVAVLEIFEGRSRILRMTFVRPWKRSGWRHDAHEPVFPQARRRCNGIGDLRARRCRRRHVRQHDLDSQRSSQMRSIAILNVEGAEPDKAWGMALYSFREATKAITEMAKSPEYRDMAVNDMGEISDAVLAANLMWSHANRPQ
jgi:hypothetical protein